MYSAAMSSPGEGVARPCKASDARKETSALRSLARRRAAMRWASGGWPWAASRPAAARVVSRRFRERTILMIPFAGRGLTGLPWISGAVCRKFAGSPVCPRLSLLHQVDDAAAGLGAAAALHLFDVPGEAVVHHQFLAAANGALADVEDVALGVHGAEIGVTTVVDDLGAAAAERAIER